MIYLDNSATTKPDQSVIESFAQVSNDYFANPSSIHHLGGKAEKLLVTARNQVANLLDVKQEEVIFTSGGTEGNNLAIKGIAMRHQARGKHIITSEIEHPSVYDACKSLEVLGFDVTYLAVDASGVICMEELKQAIREDTILISIMHVNNELGSIQPIEEIGALAKGYPKLFFHVDDVQGLGKVPLKLANSGIDLCTFSGHKIHGLKGTGVLYVKKSTALEPLFHGGSQEGSIRSGTENLAGAVAIARALRLIKASERTKGAELYTLQEYLRSHLLVMKGVEVNTPAHAAPHIINISVRGLKPEVIIHLLGEQNIFISTTSACSSKQKDENRILSACGHPKERALSALRISMSYETTKAELKTFLAALEQAITQSKKVME